MNKMSRFAFLLLPLMSSCVTDVESGTPMIQAPKVAPTQKVPTEQQNDVESLVKRKISDLDACFQQEKQNNPDARGKILTLFTIDSTGLVLDPRIEYSTFNSPTLEGCVLERIESWRFPPPAGGAAIRVHYPFAFGGL